MSDKHEPMTLELVEWDMESFEDEPDAKGGA